MFNTLQFKINLIFLLMMIGAGLASLAVIQTVGRSLVMEENYRFVEQKGRTIVTQLGQQVRYAEALAKSIADAAAVLPKDEVQFKRVIFQMLNGREVNPRVAGGGVWPEPYMFFPEKERRSFFWGQNEAGQLLYYDDYNSSDGPGYHGEEWYVPATLISDDAVFWSKSYTDPYSIEPMVTCAAPYYIAGRLSGVGTVDLALDGLKAFLDTEAKGVKGYIFAVDRNNRFLSFPDISMVKAGSREPDKLMIFEYIEASRLGELKAGFKPVSDALYDMNEEIVKRATKSLVYDERLAEKLSDSSYQISAREASLITAILADSITSSPVISSSRRIHVDRDFFLGESAVASIFLMPQTYWKIVVVYPLSEVTGAADSVTGKVFRNLLPAMLICLVIAYLCLRFVLVKPILNLVVHLRAAVQDEKDLSHPLPDYQQTELDHLAFWFNRRTMELRDSNLKLQQEIIERQQAEDALRHSEQRLKAIFQANPDPVIVYDPDGYPTHLNPAFIEVFGWSLDDLKGKRVPFVPEDQKAQAQEKIKEIYVTGNPVKFETRRFTRYGEVRCVLVSAAIIRDEHHQNTGMVVSLKDMTGVRQLEDKLRQSQKMESIGTLAGGIAHDFNNLLFPVLGFSELLMLKFSKENEEYKQIEAIHKAALRARDLVKQILTFSRQDSSEPRRMEIQPIIKEALKLVRSTIPTTIAIEQYISPDCRAIEADPTKIHQIVMNLTTNAYHAMQDSGGDLIVRLEEVKVDDSTHIRPDIPPGVYACLTVSDTGSGIEKKILDKIFDPFFTTKTIGKGTGMGLAVVHGIVKNFGGGIQVTSRPGLGSEFRIYLPVLDSNGDKMFTGNVSNVEGGNERILLVDDEAAIIEMVSMLLMDLGYTVKAFTKSVEALRAFREAPRSVDLVITDMAMPILSGDMLAAEIIKIRPELPILLLTGFSERITEEQAGIIGIKGFLMKPVSRKDLADKVRSLLTS